MRGGEHVLKQRAQPEQRDRGILQEWREAQCVWSKVSERENNGNEVGKHVATRLCRASKAKVESGLSPKTDSFPMTLKA